MSATDSKDTGSKRRRFLRAGLVIPAAVLSVGLADVGSRFVPLDVLAVRSWDVASVSPAPGGHFAANRRVEVPRAWGDLSNLGNRLELREFRREVLTTDQEGFRYREDLQGAGPARILVLGDSFAGGCGLSDEETLAARLHTWTGQGVYNAAGRFIANGRRIEELVARHLAPGGWILVVRVAPAPMPAVETGAGVARALPAAENDGGEAVAREGGLFMSRLAIVLSRARRSAEAAAGVGRSPDVIERDLPSGRGLLFRASHAKMAVSLPAVVADSWREFVSRLEGRGHRVLFVFVPQKTTVYGPLVKPPIEEAGFLRRTAERQALALESRGLEVLDLTRPLEEGARAGLAGDRLVYWQDDTHWNPAGVDLSAGAIAAALDGAAASPGPER